MAPTSRRPWMRARIAAIAAATVLGTLALAPLTASARPHTVVVVRDGFYAGNTHGYASLAFFHVKQRRVYYLRFSLIMTCHHFTDGHDYPTSFTAGAALPQGRLIPGNGVLSINWIQEDADRLGRINGEFDFHGLHPLVSFSLTADGALEDCDGFAAVPLQRAHRTPPIPSFP